MKLTNNIRDAFVRGIMQDVPKVDYSEQVRVALKADAIKQLPPKVRELANNKDLQHFIGTDRTYGLNGYISVYGRDYKPSPDVDALRKDLDAKNDAQDQQHAELREKLRQIAYSVTTRKALAEAVPEFEKYLPEDETAANRSLPVVQNVVADLVKAGWPKKTKK